MKLEHLGALLCALLGAAIAVVLADKLWFVSAPLGAFIGAVIGFRFVSGASRR